MPRTPPPPGYVTLGGAVAHLHANGLMVSRGMVYKYVEAGRLRHTGGKGPHTHKFYSIEDLNRIIEEELRGHKKPERAPVVFDWLQLTDLPACLRLDQIVYGPEIDLGEITTYQSWRQKNVKISVAAFDARDRNIMLGYVGLVPVVREQICLDILSRKRADHSLVPDEIDTYDRLGAFYLLAISAAIHPDREDLLAPMLLWHMQFWQEQFPMRYIKKIFAQVVSPEGLKLVRHLFMSPRYDLAPNAFELDLAWPAVSRTIGNFKKRLEQIAPLPPDLQWNQDDEIVIPPPVTQEIRTRPAPGERKPKESRETAPPEYMLPENLPEGTISLRELAEQEGINRTTLWEQVRDNGLAHISIPLSDLGRGGAGYERFFTPEQAEGVRVWRATRPTHRRKDQGDD